MYIDPDHTGSSEHSHTHSHEHTHADGVTHTHPHSHTHSHDQSGSGAHDQLHGAQEPHDHSHSCDQNCNSCQTKCEHTPMEELLALMKYMVGHNAAHAKELADLAQQLEQAGSHVAYEQVMAAVSDFEKGNLRLSTVLASLENQ